MNTTIRGGALRQLYNSKTGNSPVPGFAGGGLIDKIKSAVGISSTSKPTPAPAPQNAPAPILNIRKYAESTALEKRMKDADAMKTGGAIRGKGTGTSDDVPIMASNGEFMIKAKAVKKIGIEALEALNAIADTPGDKESKAEDRAEMPRKRHGGAIRKMAVGGLVYRPAVDSQAYNAAARTEDQYGFLPNEGVMDRVGRRVGGALRSIPLNAPPEVQPVIPFGGSLAPTGQATTNAETKAPAATPVTTTAPITDATPVSPATATQRPANIAAAPTEASGALPKSVNQVTRVGNSYSGAPGITGDISLGDSNGAPIRQGGAISPQNNQAADNLAARYGQTSGFGTATSGGGTVSTVPGMSQDKINATLANPDGSRWSAQDQAIMAANVRDGVDPYRGTSRAPKQVSIRQYIANQGDATARRGQDINAGAIRGQQQIAQAKLDQESKLGAVDLQTKTNILNAQNAFIAAKTPEEKAAAEENFRALQGRYEKLAPELFDRIQTGVDPATNAPVYSIFNKRTGEVGEPATQRAAPPQNHVDALKKSPALAAQFDQQYGAGSAAKILKGQ